MILCINGNYENVMDENDFAFLIDKYMGNEAKKYYIELLEDFSAEIDSLNESIQKLWDEVDLEQDGSGEKVDA